MTKKKKQQDKQQFDRTSTDSIVVPTEKDIPTLRRLAQLRALFIMETVGAKKYS